MLRGNHRLSLLRIPTVETYFKVCQHGFSSLIVHYKLIEKKKIYALYQYFYYAFVFLFMLRNNVFSLSHSLILCSSTLIEIFILFMN